MNASAERRSRSVTCSWPRRWTSRYRSRSRLVTLGPALGWANVAGVVRGVAGPGPGHSPAQAAQSRSWVSCAEHPVEDRHVALVAAGDQAALVQVHHGDVAASRLARQGRAHQRSRAPANCRAVRREEVDEAARR